MMKQFLEEVAIISAGQGAPQGDDSYCDDGIPFVKAGNLLELIEGKSIFDIQKVSDKVAKDHKLKLYKKGTVLFAKSGMSCLKGYVYVLPCDAYVVSHLACISPYEDLSDYLLFYFNYHKPNKLVKDEAYPSISLSDIGKIEIDVKDADERARIVATLGQIKLIIDNRRELIRKLDELVKARFVEMFGNPSANPFEWKEIKISEVMSGKASNGYFAKREEYNSDGNVAILGVANVVNRMYSLCTGLPRTNASLADILKFGLKYGDILFCRSSLVNEGIGKASIVPKTVPQNTLFECHVIRLPLELSLCVPEYLQVLTTTDYFRRQIISQAKTATMTTISQEGILKSLVLLPPIGLQQQFADFVAQVDKSKSVVQRQINDLQELFDKKMDEYFGGDYCCV